MHISDTAKIRDAIENLKKIKAASFSCNDGLVDFHAVTETCRIIDTLMLPLYYIWEHCCHKQLKDICFEEHLRKPYNKFRQHPITHTWELYLFVSLEATETKYLSRKKSYKKVSSIYKELIDAHATKQKRAIHHREPKLLFTHLSEVKEVK